MQEFVLFKIKAVLEEKPVISASQTGVQVLAELSFTCCWLLEVKDMQ